jgi:rhodanese-related sulfurtransferase
VVQWLRRQGIPAVNLRGGIDGWAVEVDPALSRY